MKCLNWIIRVGNTEMYLDSDKQGRYKETYKEFARKFPTHQRAEKVRKGLLKGAEFNSLVVECIAGTLAEKESMGTSTGTIEKKPVENVNQLLFDDTHVKTPTDLSNESIEKELENVLTGYSKQLKEASKTVSRSELALSDFYHYVMLEKFSITKWSKMLRVLRSILNQRAEAKETLSKLQTLHENLLRGLACGFSEEGSAENMISSVCTSLKNFDNRDRIYAPRTDLYEKLKEL